MRSVRPVLFAPAAALAVALALVSGPSASGQSTIREDASHVYAANAGWLTLRPSASTGVRVQGQRLAGRAFFPNAGWIDLGDGTPGNGVTYSNTGDDWGVNIAGDGTFSGYAYGANIGWINFGWAAPGSAQRPRLDRATGAILGYAFSANVGWIDLAAAGLAHDVAAFPDTDLDGLPDAWEAAVFGDLGTADGSTDFDQDGFSDLVEYQTGTDPRDIDSPAPARPSTVSASAKQLYSANAGWIDARPSARFGLKVGEYFLSGWLSAPNFGWISVGDGTPTNGHAYANAPAAPDDYGVNLDATGALSGYAFSANIGWINFGWAAPNDPNRPRINLATGAFSGYVYSANVGWLSFNSIELRTTSIERPDTDIDAMTDAWERENFGNLSAAGLGTDDDKDGQSDAAEYLAGTDPRDAADYFRIVSQTVNNGLTTVTLEFTSSEARRYRIEYTSQLAAAGSWTDSPLGAFAPDAGVRTTRSFTIPAPAAARFFRAVAILPLTP